MKGYYYKDCVRFGHGARAYNFRITDNISLSRMLHHSNKGFAIISACKSDLSDEENFCRTQELEDDIRKSQLGYESVVGRYMGEDEVSFLIPYNPTIDKTAFYKTILNLAAKYNQDSVLICLPEFNDGKPTYLTPQDEIDLVFEKDIHLFNEEVDEAGTILNKGKGRGFKFILGDSVKNLFTYFGKRIPTSPASANAYVVEREHKTLK